MDEDKLYKQIDLAERPERREDSDRKISEAVFDRESLMGLYDLLRKGAFTELKSIISTGKEASLFHASRGSEEVAVKIYLVETSDFRHMCKYVRGDPRFHSWKNQRQLVYMWAQKEFKNLSRVQDVIRCPKPIAFHNNILVMDFLGEDGHSAPRLKEAAIDDPLGCYNKVMGYVQEMYKLRLVHADLSEYNILYWKGEPYIIDLSAGVLLDHPSSMEFLERDIGNVVNFFKKLGVEADYASALKGVLDAG